MKNYKNIQSTFKSLNHSDWACIYNEVNLQPRQLRGGTSV
jgi:hypothetical protein